MVKQTSKTQRDLVIRLSTQSFSLRQIVKRTGLALSTVQGIVKRYQTNAPAPKIGRPRKLNQSWEKYITQVAVRGHILTAKGISKHLAETAGILVSAPTIIRALRRHCIFSRRRTKKPFISKTNKLKRLEFQRKHKHWDGNDWDRVLWTDETRICFLGADGRDRTFIRRGDPLRPHNIMPTKQAQGGSIMLWGCMSSGGVGVLALIKEKLSASAYINVLRSSLGPSLTKLGLHNPRPYFQQDNAPCHVAAKTVNWLVRHGMTLLKWPPQSPDLNPIEHLWDYLKRKIYAGPPIQNTKHLWARAQEEWGKIPTQLCLKLVRSMPSRLEAVRENKGMSTRY